MVDERLARKLSRQLRLLNIMVSFFGVITVAGLVLLGVLLWQVIAFAQGVNTQVQEFRSDAASQLDVREQACSDESLGAFLRGNTTVCSQ